MIPAEWAYSPEAYEAIAAVARAGFTHYYCGGTKNPHAIVAVYGWEKYTDIVNIRGIDRVAAARVPNYPGLDVFAPDRVVWHYLGSLVWTVRAVLKLVPPHHPEAPTTEYPAPLEFFTPCDGYRPLIVRAAPRR